MNTNLNRTRHLLAYLTILRLKSEIDSLEMLIELTETGTKRNLLCDSNIHIRTTIDCLEEYLKGDCK